jgi:hypothetical protein
MVLAYRSDEDVLRARLGALLEERGGELGAVAGAPRSIYARRVARAVAGGVAAAGGVGMLGAGALSALSLVHGVPEGALLGVLGASWAAGAIVYGPARLAAGWAFDRAVCRAPELSGNLRVDLVRLSRSGPLRSARAAIDRVESASAGLPLAALGLLLPLGAHFLIWMLLGRGRSTAGFDLWIQMSALFVGLAHLVLAHLGLDFGRRLREQANGELRAFARSSGWRAFGLTALASLLPGAIAFLIPPIVVAITGIAFIPAMFVLMGSRVRAERLRAEAALGDA